MSQAISALKKEVTNLEKAFSPKGSVGALAASYSALTNTIPYVAPAASGVMKTYQSEYIPDGYYRAADGSIKENVRAAAIPAPNYTKAFNDQGTNIGGVQFINRGDQAFNSAGNAIYSGGLDTVAVNGQQFQIPKAVIQQLMFSNAVNQGRNAQGIANFFGQNVVEQGKQRGENFANYDLINRDIEIQNNKNPFTRIEGALDPYERAKQQAWNANRQFEEAKSNMSGYTERRDSSGFEIGDETARRQNAYQQAMSRQTSAMNEVNRFASDRGTRLIGQENAQNAYRDYQFGAPTTSNLKIRETRV